MGLLLLSISAGIREFGSFLAILKKIAILRSGIKIELPLAAVRGGRAAADKWPSMKRATQRGGDLLPPFINQKVTTLGCCHSWSSARLLGRGCHVIKSAAHVIEWTII